jgi:alpha-amylase/alpha-mannosidase (GH57 family)
MVVVWYNLSIKEIIMETIYDVLRDGRTNSLLSVGDKWLIIDEIYELNGEFVVYQRKYNEKKTLELYRGINESEAVKILTES